MLGSWVANAASKGINSQIETIEEVAFGFHNRKAFRTVILFHLAGLDLYPCYPLKSRKDQMIVKLEDHSVPIKRG
jgi:hypothetical protein